MQSILKWIRVTFRKFVNSIAFVPGVIAVLFLLLSIGMIYFDFSPLGKQIKSNLHWLSLKDASTARSICTSIAGGILSLAVFSFSMVMILLNQAASQMSNRILAKLIGNRFQQVVLGFYIGTIVYALFLLSTIRDIDSGIYVPAMSTYLLITLTIIDIFLFIYFLHYITDSVKYETIINDIYTNTLNTLKHSCMQDSSAGSDISIPEGMEIEAPRSGLYQGFDRKEMMQLCEKHDLIVCFLHPVGTFLITGTPVLTITAGNKGLSEDIVREVVLLINIDRGHEIQTSYYYGLQQLMEISIRALSPGINDPGTAVLGLQALGDLMAYRLKHQPQTFLTDSGSQVRILVNEKTFDDIFEQYIYPIWDYGKDDRLVQKEMSLLLQQLEKIGRQPVIAELQAQVKKSKR